MSKNHSSKNEILCLCQFFNANSSPIPCFKKIKSQKPISYKIYFLIIVFVQNLNNFSIKVQKKIKIHFAKKLFFMLSRQFFFMCMFFVVVFYFQYIFNKNYLVLNKIIYLSSQCFKR